MLDDFFRFARRFGRNWTAVVAFLWLCLMLLCALWPALLATHDPLMQDITFMRMNEGPSRDYLFGTDAFGRDIYSRLVWGAGYALRAIAIALTIGVLLGVPAGLIAGWSGGWIDRAICAVIDTMFAIPLVLLTMAIVGVIGSGLTQAMFALGVMLSARFARLTRAVTLAEREELYIDAARITGLATPRILLGCLLPNLLPTLLVQLSVTSATVLLVSAVLSFLGVGAPPDSYDWGAMLNQARHDILRQPWPLVPPAVAIIAAVLALNLFGDGLRDAIGRDVSNNALTVRRRGKVVPPRTAPDPQALLSIRDMSVNFPGRGEGVQILDRVSFDVAAGSTLAVVGESGSGKTMTVMSALGLTPPPGQLTEGAVMLMGHDVTNLPEDEWQKIRGKDVGVIFQQPGRALNPVLSVGEQLMEPLILQLGMSRKAARARARELLELVRVPDPGRRLDEYPHQFSGGMAQRVGIAIALACNPRLLIADEPTTALDVTIQGQILDLLEDIRRETGMAIVLITHNLGVVAEIAETVAVMYAGQIVELGPVDTVLVNPQHPYTRALIATMPEASRRGEPLRVIPGVVPSPTAWPPGCRFAPRCPAAIAACSRSEPPMERRGPAHAARCLRLDELNSIPRAEAV